MEIRITLDDQTFTSMRSWLFRRRTLFVLAGVGATLPVLLYATTYTKPHTFVAGTTISSSQVNANFDGVYAAVNAHRAELDALESQAADVDGPFTHSVVFDYTGKDATFTVPEGVSRIRVEAWGGGGAGGCMGDFDYITSGGHLYGYYSGGGGGAGAYGRGDFEVSFGQSYAVKVGQAGYHMSTQSPCQTNVHGTESSLGTLVVAGGGGSVGDLPFIQTYGINLSSPGGAGGTSSAPFSVSGESGESSGICNGSECTSTSPGGAGGSAFAGGAGGRSSMSYATRLNPTNVIYCTSGVTPGGGGGGAANYNQPGCPGGAGRVVVYY